MKRVAKSIFLTALLAVLFLSACDNQGDTEQPKHTLTYDANHSTAGTAPTQQQFISGDTVLISDNSGSLERTGFTFTGWNTMSNGEGTDYSCDSSHVMSSGITLYAKWTINPLGGTGDFSLKNTWNVAIGTTIFNNLVFTNDSATITADYPDIVYSYDNASNSAILYWKSKDVFSKLTWTSTSCGGYHILHSAEVFNLLDLATATPSDLEYYVFPKQTTAPILSSSIPANGATVSKTTTSASFTFSHIMNSKISCTPSGAIVPTAPTTTWTHDFENGTSTLNFSNFQLSETPGSVSLQFFSSMTDRDGNPLIGTTINFTTTD